MKICLFTQSSCLLVTYYVLTLSYSPVINLANIKINQYCINVTVTIHTTQRMKQMKHSKMQRLGICTVGPVHTVVNSSQHIY